MAMMDASAHVGRAPARPALFADAGTPLVVFIWGVFAALMAVSAFPTVIDKLSTDDAMRLVEVRDLLAGQSWFDLVQHRLNPPDGVLMHWSRVIDLPIASLISLFGLFVSQDLAERLTVTVWPLLLFLPALLATASASRTLAGPAAGAIGAFMMVMSPGVSTRFQPAAIDHHGAQIALALILLACALRLDRSVRAAVGAGLAAALMTAIGIDTTPHVAVAAGMIAVRFAIEGGRADVARGAGLFGLSFAIFTLVAAVATLGPSAWFAPACDAFGLAHITAAVVGGGGLFLATRFARGGAAGRFSALGLLGVAVVAALAAAAPSCLASPFAALPERLMTDWIAHVQEAQSFFASTIDSPTSSLAIGLPLLAILATLLWAVATAPQERRWAVWTAAAMCGVAIAVTCWQIRGASLAFALGGTLLPIAVIAAGEAGGRLRSGLVMIGLCPSALALGGLGIASLVGLPSIEDETAAGSKLCATQDYAAFGRLPQGLALNTIDTGPFVLAFTPHSVVAAPYHRNVDGLLAALDAFGGGEEAGRAVAISRRAAYVVGCATDGGLRSDAREHPDGLSAALMGGRTPSWLEPVDLGRDTALKVWRVKTGG